jgi:predicted TIM-barrel fold metal-dependent hydrolase
LQLLEEYGFSFDLQVWQHQLSEAATVVAKVPNIQIILNHTGECSWLFWC